LGRNIRLIAWTVGIEFVRRKDFYVVLIFGGAFAAAAGIVATIGIENAATADFLTSFGLTFSYALAATLAVSMASRQLPGEFERRTLLPLLAKPLTRGEVLIGKMAAVAALAAATLATLMLMNWAALPKDEERSLAVLLQVFVLQAIGLGVVTALATMLSLALPPPVTALAALAAFFAGGPIVEMAIEAAGRAAPALGRLTTRALAGFPDFSVFQHVERFVEGGAPIGPGAFAAIAAYGAGLIALFYLSAAWAFERRALR
jgi:ABC-type transport system involved in multi-copper enzyme maturation permease subunit